MRKFNAVYPTIVVVVVDLVAVVVVIIHMYRLSVHF